MEKLERLHNQVAVIQAPWAEGKADLTRVNKIRVLAYGKGPYDGKYTILDNVISM